MRNRMGTPVAATVLALLAAAAGGLAAGKPLDFPEKSGPFGVFYAPHMECADSTTDLWYQAEMWPRVVRMIEIADDYDAKVTLLFHPQWAEFILPDPDRYRLVKDWQSRGHEVGLHYHTVVHGGWCGFTNRQDPLLMESPRYRGTVPEMMELLTALAWPAPVVSACSGQDIATVVPPSAALPPIATKCVDEIDYPGPILFDIDGFDDGLIRPMPFLFQGQPRFHLRHGVMIHREEMERRWQEIEMAGPDEIVGLVTHERDYQEELLREMFERLTRRGIRIRTVSDIMQEWLAVHPLVGDAMGGTAR